MRHSSEYLHNRIAECLDATRPEASDEADLDAVGAHAHRLLALGVEFGAAHRQARALVEDPAHRAGCGICSPEEGPVDPECPF